MKNRATKHINISGRIMLLGIVLAGLYWIFDSALDALIFREGNFAELILSPNVHITWHRLLVTGILLMFAFFTQLSITKRKRAEKEIERSYQTQTVVNKLLHISLKGIPLENMLEQIIDHIVSIPWLALESKGGIFLVEDDPKVLVMKAQRGLSTSLQTMCARVPFGRCLCGRAALSGEIEFTDSIDERHENQYESMSPHGHYCVPIIMTDRVLGVINLYLKERHRRCEKDEEFLHAVANVLAGIIQRKQVETEAKELRQQMEFILGATKTGLDIIDSEFNIRYIDEEWKKVYGDTTGKKCYEYFMGRSEVCPDCGIPTALETKAITVTEEVLVKENNRPIQVTTMPFQNENGEWLVAEVNVDITERKQAEEQIKKSLKEKEILLREIHHRVKNNMQVISSLLSLQAGYIKDKRVLDVFNESGNRIRAMALVHERLYRSEGLVYIDFGEYIRYLALNLFHSYQVNSEAVTLKVNAHDVSLDVDTAIPCGLIINELVSNSLKHAFPRDRQGEIRIDLHSDNSKSTLIVSDNGVGLPKDLDFKNTESLGLQLVNTLTGQIDGTIELDTSGGTAFKITFPG